MIGTIALDVGDLGELVPDLLDGVEVGHVGHRAAGVEVGEDDLLVGPVRMSADSAMKWTPQKTTNSASRCSAAKRDSPNESPRMSANWITSSRW